ncbi:hypothetical protein AB0E59_40875 [Lentzea sp. NPDC034063]|uniref:hypothetical protein n=1 Tax=unclassified Lentzea TaxID=2643253 RepID=UPI0033C12AE1
MQGREAAEPLFDAGDWIALAAVAVAIVAVVIAIMQVREASKARKATEVQADNSTTALGLSARQAAAGEKSATHAMLSLGTADRAADAAEEQAVTARQALRTAEDQVTEAAAAVRAAEAQVEIMRQALEAENAERHERRGPQFSVAETGKRNNSRVLTVTMLSGPPVVSVRPSWTADSSAPGSDGDHVGGIQAGDYEPQPMMTNDSFEIEVVAPTITKPMVVQVYLRCLDVDDESSSWERTRSVRLEPGPQLRFI